METFRMFFIVFAFLGMLILIGYSLNKDSNSSMFKKSKSNDYKALQFVMNFYSSIGMLINVIVIIVSFYTMLITDNFVTQTLFRHRSATFGNEPFESGYFFGMLFGGILTGVTCMGLSQAIKLLFELKEKSK